MTIMRLRRPHVPAVVALDDVALNPHVTGIDEAPEAVMADRAIDAMLAV